jgi:hypothetical protein
MTHRGHPYPQHRARVAAQLVDLQHLRKSPDGVDLSRHQPVVQRIWTNADGCGALGVMLSAHTFGMFALSPVTGWWIDRANPPTGDTGRACARRGVGRACRRTRRDGVYPGSDPARLRLEPLLSRRQRLARPGWCRHGHCRCCWRSPHARWCRPDRPRSRSRNRPVDEWSVAHRGAGTLSSTPGQLTGLISDRRWQLSARSDPHRPPATERPWPPSPKEVEFAHASL